MALGRKPVAPAQAHREALESTERWGSRALRASISLLVVLAWWAVLTSSATRAVGGHTAAPIVLVGLGVAGVNLVGRPQLPLGRAWLVGLGWLVLATLVAGGSLTQFFGGAGGGADLAGWLLGVGSLAVGFEAGRTELDERWLRVLVGTTLVGLAVAIVRAVAGDAFSVLGSTLRLVVDGPFLGRGFASAGSGRLLLDVALAGGVPVVIGLVASLVVLARRLWAAGQGRFGRGAFAGLMLWSLASFLAPHDGSLTALVLILVGATLGTAAEAARRVRQMQGGHRSRPGMDLVDRWALASISLLLGWVLSALVGTTAAG